MPSGAAPRGGVRSGWVSENIDAVSGLATSGADPPLDHIADTPYAATPAATPSAPQSQSRRLGACLRCEAVIGNYRVGVKPSSDCRRLSASCKRSVL